jgi:predicted RNA-binding protein with RPS1 domain
LGPFRSFQKVVVPHFSHCYGCCGYYFLPEGTTIQDNISTQPFRFCPIRFNQVCSIGNGIRCIGYKQLQPEPWVLASEKYAEGDVIHGKVVRIVPFGAFVEVEKGIDGLVHISQITHEYLENPTTVLSIGQEIDAKILKLDPNEKKMTLSIKALEPKPENLERKPKKEKEEGEEKEKVRKPRKEKPADEMTEWNDVEDVSVSIADLLNSNS